MLKNIKAKKILVTNICFHLHHINSTNNLFHLYFIQKKQAIHYSLLFINLYSRWESNPHFRRNWILNPARLPIPPLEQFWTAKIENIFLQSIKIRGFYNFLK